MNFMWQVMNQDTYEIKKVSIDSVNYKTLCQINKLFKNFSKDTDTKGIVIVLPEECEEEIFTSLQFEP